jgi:membrane protease YdiL (CAAX protease family)
LKHRGPPPHLVCIVHTTAATRTWLATEFTLLFFVAPVLLVSRVVPNQPIAVLIIVTIAVLTTLRRDPRFEFAAVLRAKGMARPVGAVILRALAAAVGLGLGVLWWNPALLFGWAGRGPRFWLAFVLLYPLVSVFPQELVYRAFLFHRYSRLLASERTTVLASALAFAFAHVVYRNALAVVLSFIGGLLFSFTYRRTRSLLLAWLEHAIVGCAVFALGLGAYFDH